MGSAVSSCLGALLLTMAVSTSGCAWLDSRAQVEQKATVATSDEALIIDDLVSALTQLHSPLETTVQVGLDNPPVYDNLVDRIVNAGYGVQRVDADQGAHFVSLSRFDVLGNGTANGIGTPVDSWQTNRMTDDGAARVRYELSVGATTLSRAYGSDGDSLRPASPMAISGTRRGVVLDDGRFGAQADRTVSRVVYAGVHPALDSMPLISLITDDVVRGVARDLARGPSLAAVNSSKVEVTNLFYDDGSAFGGLRDSFTPVKRLVVIFPNDSMRLGREGKRSIEQFIEGFRESTDMIGLIGCSNGPTALAMGNEGLALGRSARVTEEVVSHGIARQHIIDEGCWAPVNAGDRFPSRGVVMELLRKGA